MQQSDRRVYFTADAKFAVKPATAGKPMQLEGYALVWNVVSSDRGGYKVRLLPNSATFATPTLALYHHDTKAVIGNTENGTLRLTPDDYGVKVEIDLPDTSTGRDVAELVGKKYVRGMSFAMISTPRGHVTRENGNDIFEAEAYAVDEITVTPIPAFVEATVGTKPPEQPATSHAVRTEQAIKLERFKLDLHR